MAQSKAERIRVRVNGEMEELNQSFTVLELLSQFQIKSDSVVLELNRQILEKGRYSSTYLRDGDSLEIVHFVGGGTR